MKKVFSAALLFVFFVSCVTAFAEGVADPFSGLQGQGAVDKATNAGSEINQKIDNAVSSAEKAVSELAAKAGPFLQKVGEIAKGFFGLLQQLIQSVASAFSSFAQGLSGLFGGCSNASSDCSNTSSDCNNSTSSDSSNNNAAPNPAANDDPSQARGNSSN